MKGNLDSATLKRIESPCGCAAVVEQTEADAGMTMFFCRDHSALNDAVAYDSQTDVVFHPPFGWDYNVCPS